MQCWHSPSLRLSTPTAPGILLWWWHWAMWSWGCSSALRNSTATMGCCFRWRHSCLYKSTPLQRHCCWAWEPTHCWTTRFSWTVERWLPCSSLQGWQPCGEANQGPSRSCCRPRLRRPPQPPAMAGSAICWTWTNGVTFSWCPTAPLRASSRPSVDWAHWRPFTWLWCWEGCCWASSLQQKSGPSAGYCSPRGCGSSFPWLF